MPRRSCSAHRRMQTAGVALIRCLQLGRTGRILPVDRSPIQLSMGAGGVPEQNKIYIRWCCIGPLSWQRLPDKSGGGCIGRLRSIQEHRGVGSFIVNCNRRVS